MCKAIEDMRNEVAQRTAENTLVQNIKNLMETMKLTAEQAMDALKVVDADRKKLSTRL